MPGDISRIKAWYALPEVAYGVVADPTGAAALWIPAMIEPGTFPSNERSVIQRNFASGRNRRSPIRLGPGKSSVRLKGWFGGYTDAVEAGAPPAEDAIGTLLQSMLGAPLTNNGGTATAGAAASITTALALTQGQLVCTRGPVTNGARAQWRRVTGAASPYAIAPDWTDNPVNADIIFGGRTYYPKVMPNTLFTGLSFSLIGDMDGRAYVMPGCRCHSFSIKASAGGGVEWEAEIQGNERLRQAFAALPAPPASDPEPTLYTLSPLLVNGASLDVASIEIDLAPEVTDVRGQATAQGRSNKRVVALRPTVKIDPLNDTVWEDVFDAATVFDLVAQFGAGEISGTRVQATAFAAGAMQLMQPVNQKDDSGVTRQDLVLGPVDAGITGAAVYDFLIGRV